MKMLASASASPLPTNLSMNLRTHILRSIGYRELGMFDESILELEEIEGEDRWHTLVVEARYNTYPDAKE
jgi:hypothetical protein